MTQSQRNKRIGGYKASVLEFVSEKKFWLCFCLIHCSLIFFFFAYNDSNLPQQGGNLDRCGTGCVVLDWLGRSIAELAVVLASPPELGSSPPALLPSSMPALLPSALPNHLHIPFQMAAVLVLQLRLAIKLQAEVFHEKCCGIMNDPKQSKQNICSTRVLLLLVSASGKCPNSYQL